MVGVVSTVYDLAAWFLDYQFDGYSQVLSQLGVLHRDLSEEVVVQPVNASGHIHTLVRLISTTPIEIRKNLSDLIYHEKTDDDNYLCYYKNLASHNPITYLCSTGCCPNGCCAFQEVKRSGSYDLAVILLLIFVFAILFTAVTMLIIYYIYNRKSGDRGYEFSGSFTEDSTVGSQADGPPSYFGEHRYLPHINPVKLF